MSPNTVTEVTNARFAQRPVPFAGAHVPCAQTFPQAPQLFTSIVGSTHVLPHGIWGAVHVAESPVGLVSEVAGESVVGESVTDASRRTHVELRQVSPVTHAMFGKQGPPSVPATADVPPVGVSPTHAKKPTAIALAATKKEDPRITIGRA